MDSRSTTLEQSTFNSDVLQERECLGGGAFTKCVIQNILTQQVYIFN